MTAAWLTDNRRPDRLAYDRALVRRAGVPADKLPPLVRTGSVVGEVRGRGRRASSGSRPASSS